MRTLARRPTRRAALASLLAVTLAMIAGAAPAAAKEGFQAALDAPIARESPGGTTLLVGLTVTYPDATGVHPIEGSPIYLKLTGPDRTVSWALGREDAAHGHYTVRATVPASGIADVEVGIHGTSDMPIDLVGVALVTGRITARTAQVAPPEPLAVAPRPRASVPVPAVAPAVAPAVVPGAKPAAEPSAVPAAGPGSAALLPALVAGGLALAAAALALVAVRRSHVRGGPPAQRRPNEA